VDCASGAGGAQLSVTDDGPGIAPQEQARIFERFYRTLGNEESGSGLGLSIVQRITELHSARIGLRADDSGHGSTFTVTFPPSDGVEVFPPP
jgi:two-component system OmpR family sensor kinase